MAKRPMRLLALLLVATLAISGCSGVEKPQMIGAEGAQASSEPPVAVVNLNTEENASVAPEGVAVPNYHLYGYDVLNAGYIHTQDIKDRPILDPDKFDPKFFTAVDQSWDEGSQSIYTFSTRINEFYNKFNSDVSAEYKGVAFSGKVDTEFGTKKQTSETQTFIRFIQYHTVYKTAFIGEDEDLVAMLSPQFKKDIITYKDDPARIFNKYGTHLITKYYLGGRADLNFVFNNSSSLQEKHVEGAVQASYARISGKASVDDVVKSKDVLEHSTLTLKTYGGDFVSGTTVDSIAAQFPDWLKSIESKPNICRLGNWDDSMFPIWNLVEDKDIAAALEAEFNRQAKGRQIAMDGMVDIAPAPPVSKDYIREIAVYSAKNQQDALDKLPSGYRWVFLNPGTTDPVKKDWAKSALDCNHGAGGDYVYIAYKTSKEATGAITDIYTASGKNTIFPEFTKRDNDLNRGAGGDFIYLHYRKAAKADLANPKTRYLRDIRGIYGKKTTTTLPAGWAWPQKDVDLNKGAGGDYIYLAVRKD